MYGPTASYPSAVAGVDYVKPIDVEIGGQPNLWFPNIDASLAEQEAMQAHLAGLAELPVFDKDILVQIVGNKPTVHQRILGKFLSDVEEKTKAIHQACLAQESDKVASIAHALKSVARTVGAMRLGYMSEELEHAGKAADFQTLLALLPEYLKTYVPAMSAIRDYLNNN